LRPFAANKSAEFPTAHVAATVVPHPPPKAKLVAPDSDGCLVPHMSHCKGKDNVKKRTARRKKLERLQAAKSAQAKST
jgi:hypothetical protein